METKKLIKTKETPEDVALIVGPVTPWDIAAAKENLEETYEMYAIRGEKVTQDNLTAENILYTTLCNDKEPVEQLYALLYLSQYKLVHKYALRELEKQIMCEPFKIWSAYQISKIAARTKPDSWLVKLFKDGGTAKLFSMFAKESTKIKTDILNMIGAIYCDEKETFQEKIRAEEILMETLHSKEIDDVKAMALAYIFLKPPHITDNRHIIGMYSIMNPMVAEKADKLLKNREERIKKKEEKEKKQKEKLDELLKKIKISGRTRIKINEEWLRLSEVAQKYPEVLIRILCGSMEYKAEPRLPRCDAIFSAFAKIGLRRVELHNLVEAHPEWGINVRVLDQM